MATAAAQDAADCAIVDQLGRSAGEWEQEHTARFQQIDQGAPLPAFPPAPWRSLPTADGRCAGQQPSRRG